MSADLSLSIDGRQVTVEPGVTLIEAAAAAGTHVPNLCHVSGMKGVGACRLCVVEVEGADAPVTACTTKAREGMVVATDSERVREIRRFVLDLILSMHPSDCMTCAKAGVCDLQRYAYEHDVAESSFTRKRPGYAVDDSNPFIRHDPDYCILCGRCVRVCEAQGTEVLRVSGRGLGSRIVSGTGSGLEQSGCTFCGNCLDACPVGALLPVEAGKRGRQWEYAKTLTACLACGCGCEVVASTNGGQVVGVGSPAILDEPGRFICSIGRYGYEAANGHLRVLHPLKRVRGELVETDWEDALAIVAAKMAEAKGDVGVVTSGSILTEDALRLKQLVDGVLGLQDYDSSVSLYADSTVLSTAGGEMDWSDLVVLLGLAPDQWERTLAALDAAIRERVRSGQAALVVLNAGRPAIASAASAVLQGDEVASVERLCRALSDMRLDAGPQSQAAPGAAGPSEEVRRAAELFAAARNPLVLAPPALYGAAANLASFKGKAVAVPFEANARGVARAGLLGAGRTYSEILEAPPAVLYAVGELLLPPRLSARPPADFLVVQTAFMTELAGRADVVLPAATVFESQGSITDALGHLKQVRRACAPNGEARQDGDIFASLAEALGAPLDTAEIRVGTPGPPEEKAGLTAVSLRSGWYLDPARLGEAACRSLVRGSRLAWLSDKRTTGAA
jgi:NADH dehydrogenase/NADH:ubiquinone oxidoreductase subunit G